MISRECFNCQMESRFDELPPRELIAYDQHWRVAVAVSSKVPGWLILSPRRHVMELAELTITEAATLGSWQHRLARILHDELGTPKTYIAEFGEAPGYHLHFHVVPRPVALGSTFRGPKVFELLSGAPGSELLTDVDKADDAAAARDRLAGRLASRLTL